MVFGIVVVIWEGPRKQNGANGGGSLRRVSTYERDVLGDWRGFSGDGESSRSGGNEGGPVKRRHKQSAIPGGARNREAKCAKPFLFFIFRSAKRENRKIL